jgi:UPF0755 protein
MARKRSRNSRLLTLGALAAVIVVGAWVWREIAGAASPTGEPARVVVPRGASLRVAAESLSAQGVIGSTRLFRLFARATGAETTIKPGTYQFTTDAGYRDVLDALVTGRGLMATVVIPEGFDLRDITPALSRALDVPADSVRAAMTDTTWLRKLEVPVASLEGYLFPATYTFPAGTTAREAVDVMVERFLDAWKPEWDARLQAMSISRHDAITMASIVEKEARKPEERPIISAVYWNRVKKGMRLQADPTVQYALPQHVARVLYKDLEVDSKYNTYRNAGLPPGPIASPGEASIAAALSPADVPYLFFVARPDGGHEFRTTFAEHAKAIADIKRAKRATDPAPR